MKRFLSLFLVGVLLLSLTVPAYADEPVSANLSFSEKIF